MTITPLQLRDQQDFLRLLRKVTGLPEATKEVLANIDIQLPEDAFYLALNGQTYEAGALAAATDLSPEFTRDLSPNVWLHDIITNKTFRQAILLDEPLTETMREEVESLFRCPITYDQLSLCTETTAKQHYDARSIFEWVCTTNGDLKDPNTNMPLKWKKIKFNIAAQYLLQLYAHKSSVELPVTLDATVEPLLDVSTNPFAIIELIQRHHLDIDADTGDSLLIRSLKKRNPIADILLEHGANPNHTNSRKRPALFYAIKTQNILMVNKLLRAGANIKYKDPDGRTPLWLATRIGDIDIVTALLRNHEKPHLETIKTTTLTLHGEDNETIEVSSTPLLEAVCHKHYNLVRPLLVAGANPNFFNELRHTALLLAVREGQADSAELLANYATPEIIDLECIDTGETPLLTAIRNYSVRLVFSLLKSGANANKAINPTKAATSFSQHFLSRRTTPLMLAAAMGNIQMLQLLLDHDADPNIPDEQGLTSLIIACENGHLDVVKLLVESGADINASDSNSYNAVIAATHYQKPDILSYLTKHKQFNINQSICAAAKFGMIDLVKELIALGANVNATTDKGLSPLSIAIKERKFEIAEMLLEAGADPTIVDKERHTPLYYAIEQVSPEMIELLLMYDKTQIDDLLKDRHLLESNPLYADLVLLNAIRKNQTSKVQQLLEQEKVTQTQINVTAPSGMDTPLIAATKNGNHAIIKMLVKHGANINGCIPLSPKVYRKYYSDLHYTLFGLTPLILASARGDTETVKCLISSGALVDKTDGDEATPLLVAIWKGHLETVKELVKNHANIHHISAELGNVVTASIMSEHDDIFYYFIDHPDMQNINVLDHADCTPLIVASSKGREEIVRILLERNAEINLTDCSGYTALSYAIQNNYLATAEQLLAAQADPNIADETGTTPLMYAIKSEENNTALVKMLLEKSQIKIDLYQKNSRNLSALDIAKKIQNPEIIEMLEQYRHAASALGKRSAETPAENLESSPDVRRVRAGNISLLFKRSQRDSDDSDGSEEAEDRPPVEKRARH